uniref:Uncharacterized protein n=1 Tax=Arundo donax TaxID=35708 RepID=A0A0A9C4V0_ARUDO
MTTMNETRSFMRNGHKDLIFCTVHKVYVIGTFVEL